MKRFFVILLVLALLLSGCGQTADPEIPANPDTPETPQADTQVSDTPAATQDPSAYFSDKDFDADYEAAECISVALTGTEPVTITQEGTYLLTGSLEGCVTVDVLKTEKVRLILAGVNIQNPTGPALYIRQADKVFLTTASGTENTLQSDAFTDAEDAAIDGAVFSKEDLTCNGEGKLTVISPAGHGIVSKDSLTVTSGTYEVTCAGHALAGKDDVAVAGGTFTLTAGKDGIHAENADDAALGTVYIGGGAFTVTAEGDGISAAATVQIDGGDYHIVAGGGSANGTKASSDNWGFMGGGHGGMGGRPGSWGDTSGSTTQDTTDSTSMKGVKSGLDMTITGGSFTMDTADDGLHSNASLRITGGSFTIATGDDGIHAEETLTVEGGVITVTESYEGLEALHIKILGGSITATASDDGINAAGGNDQSGTEGGRDGMFGGMGGQRPNGGGMGGFGGMSAGNGSVTISGGTVYLIASGDGIDANGTLTISGGHTTVCGPTQGDTATLDYDTSAVITGGTFLGTGGAGMAQSFSDSEQGVIAISVGGSVTAGTVITLADASGAVILEYAPALNFAVVILSSPEMVKGESYTITVGSQSGTFTAN